MPDKQPTFQNESLSQITITRRVEEIGSYFKDQLNSGVDKYISVLLALDESRTLTLQLNFLFLSEV